MVDIPAGTKQIIVAIQIYGPGNVWFDDVEAEYTAGTGHRRDRVELSLRPRPERSRRRRG